MKFIIIEDETFIALNLAECIKKIRPGYERVKILSSVKEAVDFFQNNKSYDLVFSDISLSDGMSFEIFDQAEVASPVIFCTAYENYAVEAFEKNGIDFILKPFSEERVKKAILKFEKLAFHFISQQQNIKQLSDTFSLKKVSDLGKSLLVHYKDKIIPIPPEDVALFYIENGITCLVNFNGEQFVINKTLEEIEVQAGTDFFKANRQFLIHKKAVKEVSRSFTRKLILHLTFKFSGDITVSKEKSSVFLKWIST